VIPDEAVEAAAAKLPAIWSSSPVYRDNLRAALEAAAPHLMAAAWDEGYLACVDDAFRDKELGKTGQRLEDGQQNPYRKAPDA